MSEDTFDVTVIPGIIYLEHFLFEAGFNPEALLAVIMFDKAEFFQPRGANYMKFRGNEIKRTKAFVYDSNEDSIPVASQTRASFTTPPSSSTVVCSSLSRTLCRITYSRVSIT